MAVARERLHFDRFSLLVTPSGYQTLRTYPVKDNSVIKFDITLTVRQTDGANRAIFKRSGLFFRESAGPVQLQGLQWQTLETVKSDENLNVKFLLGATDLVIQVRNAGNVATRWTGFVDKIEVR